jgi:hypothetical protein
MQARSEAADKMVEMARAVGQKSEAMLEAALKQNLKSLEDELQSLADKRK